MPEPTFRSPDGAETFFAAYDQLLARWPEPTETVDLQGPFGSTRVTMHGATDGTPLVLLPGGGASGLVWFATAAGLGEQHRVYAVDVMGQAGRSVHSGQQLQSVDELLTWLDGVLDGLGLTETALGGHSYGGWMALRYAMHAPTRVRRLVLVDPTMCFAGMSPAYLLHAVPLLSRPSTKALDKFARWETGGQQLDPDVSRLSAAGASDFPSSKVVAPRRPDDEELTGLAVPTLLLLAGRSRCHDIDKVGKTAGRLLPDVRTVVLPEDSHQTLPSTHPGRLNDEVGAFLA